MRQFVIFSMALTFSVAAANAQSSEGRNNDSTQHHQHLQVSFFPGFGSGGAESWKTTYNISLNIFAGYVGGIDGIELGGFSNTVKTGMSGIQLAGFSNQVLGHTQGVQASGFSNFVKGETDAVQLSGFANTNLARTKGIQGAGFSNVVKGEFEGVQLSGFSNWVSGRSQGIQLSGFSNITMDPLNGVQASGFSNVVTGDLDGFQVSGFSNIVLDAVDGFQVSGFGNVARDLDGFQAAGFFNCAKTVNGLQLGFLNVADTFSSGIPVGFLSWVRDGYHQGELSFSETRGLGLSYRTGVETFYNIFSAGINPAGKDLVWGFGYGVGTLRRFNEKWSMNIDLTAHHLNYGASFTTEENTLASLHVEANYRLGGSGLTLFGGPVMNGFFTSVIDSETGAYKDTAVPYKVWGHENSRGKQIFYPGVKLGIRL